MTRRDVPTLLFLGLACVFGMRSCSAGSAEARIALELDSLRSELLVARVDSAGWATAIAEAREGLEFALREAVDSTDALSIANAELADQVATLGGRIRSLQRINAQLEGQVAAAATVHATQDSARNITSAQNIYDSITAPIDDGFLRGRVAYRPPEQRFDLTYRAELALTLGLVELADGRHLMTARPSDERVTLTYGDVFVQQPDPVAYCSIPQRLRTSGWAIAGWEGLKLLVDQLYPNS